MTVANLGSSAVSESNSSLLHSTIGLTLPWCNTAKWFEKVHRGEMSELIARINNTAVMRICKGGFHIAESN